MVILMVDPLETQNRSPDETLLYGRSRTTFIVRRSVQGGPGAPGGRGDHRWSGRSRCGCWRRSAAVAGGTEHRGPVGFGRKSIPCRKPGDTSRASGRATPTAWATAREVHAASRGPSASRFLAAGVFPVCQVEGVVSPQRSLLSAGVLDRLRIAAFFPVGRRSLACAALG